MKTTKVKAYDRRKDFIAAVIGTVAMFGLFYWMAVIASN